MTSPTWTRILALSLGGVLGVNARYWLGVAIARVTSHPFPWATFLVNVSGSFAIGVGATLLAGHSPHSPARLLLLTGFLGGFTTFSAFSLESVGLWRGGERMLSLVNVLGSLAAGCAAVVLGAALAERMERPHPRAELRPGMAPTVPGHDEQRRQGGQLERER
jgi:CrcB protein